MQEMTRNTNPSTRLVVVAASILFPLGCATVTPNQKEAREQLGLQSLRYDEGHPNHGFLRAIERSDLRTVQLYFEANADWPDMAFSGPHATWKQEDQERAVLWKMIEANNSAGIKIALPYSKRHSEFLLSATQVDNPSNGVYPDHIKCRSALVKELVDSGIEVSERGVAVAATGACVENLRLFMAKKPDLSGLALQVLVEWMNQTRNEAYLGSYFKGLDGKHDWNRSVSLLKPLAIKSCADHPDSKTCQTVKAADSLWAAIDSEAKQQQVAREEAEKRREKERNDPEAAKLQVCAAHNNLAQLLAVMKRHRAVASETGGIVNTQEVYQTGEGIVFAKQLLQGAINHYQGLTGKKFKAEDCE